MDKILGLVKQNWLPIAGGIAGAISGYIYWLKVGCTTGTCPLQATPTANIILGALIGVFVLGLFKKK